MRKTFASLQERFLIYLKNEQRRSDATLKTYGYQIGNYLSFLEDKGWNPSSVTREQVATYHPDNRSASTLFLVAIAVKQFHRFLRSRGLSILDPTEGVTLPKIEHLSPEPLTHEQIGRLFSTPVISTFISVRNRAMFELIYSTGIRISELTGIHMNDIDLTQDTVRVLGKGNKRRVLPFGRQAKEALVRYLKARDLRFGASVGKLFLNFRGKGITRGGVWLVLRGVAKQAGISRRASPHTLRHSFATHMLAGGSDLRVIQEMLGHARISTTQIYTHVDLAQMKKASSQAHPRA